MIERSAYIFLRRTRGGWQYSMIFEIKCMLVLFITSMGLSAAYDIFRGMRRGVPHGKGLCVLQDIIYSIYWLITMIYVVFTYCNGILRSYVIIGYILGMVCYYLLFSKLLLRLISHITRKINNVFTALLANIAKSHRKDAKTIEKNSKNS